MIDVDISVNAAGPMANWRGPNGEHILVGMIEGTDLDHFRAVILPYVEVTEASHQLEKAE